MPKKGKVKRTHKPISIYLTADQQTALEKMSSRYQKRIEAKIGSTFESSVSDFVRRLIEAYGDTFADSD